jgi:hypothetical protein
VIYLMIWRIWSPARLDWDLRNGDSVVERGRIVVAVVLGGSAALAQYAPFHAIHVAVAHTRR